MEKSQVEEIRKSTRSELNYNRRAHRDEEADIRRHTEAQNVTQDYVVELSNKLKSKSGVTATDISLLKNALADHPEYIGVVLKTQGALRGLVREFTGQDAKRQLAAAGCLCNMVQTDDEHACVTLVKLAGPYLVAALDSLNTELAITAAWTLANAAGCLEAASSMTSQGALSKLSALMTSPDDVRQAAVTALVQITRVLADDLTNDHASIILQALSNTELSRTSSQLLFILSCHSNFNELHTKVNERFLRNILETTTAQLPMLLSLVHTDRSKFVNLLRTLANVDLNDSVYNMFVNHFALYLEDLKRVIKMNIKSVNEALIWLFGNLYNYSSDNEFFVHLLS